MGEAHDVSNLPRFFVVVLITLIFQQYSTNSRDYSCTFEYPFNGEEILTKSGIFGGIRHISDSQMAFWLELLKV